MVTTYIGNRSLGTSNYPNHTKGNINMSTTFEEMTNKELKEACEDFGLTVEANNPAKPNKTEYLEALNAFKAKQDELHGVDPEAVVEKEKVDKVTDGSKRKPQSKSKLMKLDLYKKDRVVIHDNQESQTKDEMISVSWGNRLIGRQTDWVDLSGEPQYVRRGALGNLREATMVAHVAKPNGGASQVRKKRFIIVEVEAHSDQEFADLKAQQKMRNSKIGGPVQY